MVECALQFSPQKTLDSLLDILASLNFVKLTALYVLDLPHLFQQRVVKLLLLMIRCVQ